MIVKKQTEEDKLREIGKIVAEVREAILKAAKAGVTTKALDELGGTILSKYGAKSAPIKDYDFPGYTCLSVNQVAAHGIPGGYVLKDGDMFNVDVSAELGGYYADTGKSIVIGLVEQEDDVRLRLCKIAESALYEGIAAARPDNRINDIGSAIFKEAKKHGFTVIMNLTGHGIGRHLHEAPQAISNYYCESENQRIKKGHVLAIETFISNGSNMVREESDGWTLKTIGGGLVAQFEHTVIVTDENAIIIT